MAGTSSAGSLLKWLKVLSYPALFITGLVVGLYGSDKLFRPGCSLKLSMSSGIETSCPSPYAVFLNFGEKPSARALDEALSIVQDRTQGQGQARIYIDQTLLSADFAKTMVHPPSGSQPSLKVVQQLLEEARVSRMVDICLAPDAGFHVQLAQGASRPPVQ
jgi:hypothetical protein